jgi:formate/nitrite transporter FocA (FNT family)
MPHPDSRSAARHDPQDPDGAGNDAGQTPSGRSFSAVEQLEELSGSQKQEVRAQSRPSAALIHETIRAEGETELEREASGLLLSGLAAGLSIGFSLVVQGKLHQALPEGAARDLIAPLGYTTGFLIVVLGRQQLFTENTLTPVLPLLHHRDRATLGKVVRLWVMVLLANLAGAVLFAAALAGTAAFAPPLKDAFAEISRHTLAEPFGLTALRAVFAGWLIALMVWLLPAAESGRIWVILLITYVVGLGGFPHVIAGSVECAYLVFQGEAGIGDFVMRFFLPTLLGNVLGGVALVAVLNYGQVAQEIAREGTAD